MSRRVLLNNVEHADLKVTLRHGAEFGDAVNLAAVFATEFAEVQREYPILFRKDENDAFQAVALLGFDSGENLFLDSEGWKARYIPAIHQRGPFMIGYQDQEVDGETRREPVLYIDLDDPRVGTESGHPVFLKHGGNAPLLEQISHHLRVVHTGVIYTKPMFDAFEAAELIEPVELDIKLDQHTNYKVPNMFTVSQERLAALDGAALEKLNQPGFLKLAYLAATSLPNIQHLIARKNARRAAQSA